MSARPSPLTTDHSPLSLPELALIFARTGSLAFGGGGSTLAMLHAEFCTRRRLLSEEQFQLLFSLSRLVPGMNLLALTVLLGHRTHGIAGALLSLAALTVPSFSLILLGCMLLQGSPSSPALTGAMRGLSVGVAVLLMETAWRLCQGTLAARGPTSRTLYLLLVAAALILGRVEGLHPAWVVLGGGALGFLLFPLLREDAP